MNVIQLVVGALPGASDPSPATQKTLSPFLSLGSPGFFLMCVSHIQCRYYFDYFFLTDEDSFSRYERDRSMIENVIRNPTMTCRERNGKNKQPNEPASGNLQYLDPSPLGATPNAPPN
jgi:hypothetical protein